MRKIPYLLLALAITLTPQIASAHYLSHPDPQDTPGGLDIARVNLRSPGRDLVGRVDLYRHRVRNGWWGWSLDVAFDSRGDGRMDFFMEVGFDSASGGIYQRSLYRRGVRFVDTVNARWDGEVIHFRFPEHLLKKTRDVRWQVRLSSHDGKHDTDGLDLAPDAGWYEH